MEDTFTPEVQERLGYYVYRLIDPRNGETFYVGKGKGNRVFAHARAALASDAGEDEENLKYRTIREITGAGLEVITVIHRHGLKDEATAYEVEAALIDAYPGLTNVQDGHNSDFGVMHSREVIRLYGAQTADLDAYDGCLIIKLNPKTLDANNGNVYKTVRYAWKLKTSLVEKNTAPYVFAVVNGIIRSVFSVERWILVPEEGDKLAFDGTENSELTKQFGGLRIPDKYRQKGAANPTVYIKKG